MFYHSTIKRLVAVFGSCFDEVYYQTDKGKKTKVPLFYAPSEKFIALQAEHTDLGRLQTNAPLPRLGFELVGLNYAPERMLNPLHRITKEDDAYQRNRVPYDFSFMLHIASRDMETGLKILEQILPLFTPSFNVTIDEVDDMQGLKNDIAIVLNSTQQTIEYQGDFSGQRVFLWSLQFTMKAYLYQATHYASRIKEVITRLTTSEMDARFHSIEDHTLLVVPREAERNDPHVVEESTARRDKPFEEGSL